MSTVDRRFQCLVHGSGPGFTCRVVVSKDSGSASTVSKYHNESFMAASVAL